MFQSYPDIDGPYPSNGPSNMRMPAAADDPWNPGNPYHEEVQFPPQQSFQVTRLDKIGLGPRAKTRAPK